MNNNVAIQILREARQRIVEDSSKQLAEIDKSIHSLQTSGTSTPLETGSVVKPGQYANMKSTDALTAYLGERAGVAVPIEIAVADLQTGGAHLGNDPKRHERNLKIGISNNSRKFEYDQNRNTVMLIPGSGPRVRKRKKAKP